MSASVSSGATVLSGTSPANALTSSFAAGDTITVNGQIITFVASGAAGNNQVNVTDNITTLLGKIDTISTTGTPSSISATTGKITLNDNIGALTVKSSNAAAFAALGFSGTVATPTNSLQSSFVAGNSITVDATSTITFYTGTAPAPVSGTTFVNLATATVGSLLSTIDGITGTGNPSTINASTGAITLHTGTAQDLSVASGAAGFTALGFGTTMTAARTGGGTPGTGLRCWQRPHDVRRSRASAAARSRPITRRARR